LNYRLLGVILFHYLTPECCRNLEICIVLSMQPFLFCYFIKCQGDIQISKNASGSVLAYGINPLIKSSYLILLFYQYFVIAKILFKYNDTSIITYVCVFHLFWYDMRQYSEMKFYMAELERSTDTPTPRCIVGISILSLFLNFLWNTHDAKFIFLWRPSVHPVLHQVGSVGWWEGLVFLMRLSVIKVLPPSSYWVPDQCQCWKLVW
jgi:hypothetical protein